MAHDPHETATGPNVARYFVENRHISWVLFLGVLAWGVGAYQAMPKRKDPDIPVRQVAVVTPWPGQSAERVEQLVTRKIEEKIAQNMRVSEMKSRSRAGLSVVYAEVDDRVPDTAKEFDDIKIKLDSLTDLPQGAGPVQYIKEFGETAALIVTVASPPAGGEPLELLASTVAEKINPESVNVVLCGTGALDHSFLREAAELLSQRMRVQGMGEGTARLHLSRAPVLVDGNGFVLITGIQPALGLQHQIAHVWDSLPQRADLHPDVWDPIVIEPGAPVLEALRAKAGAKYSYRELDDFTESIERAVRGTPEVSRVTRVGLLEEEVELLYSQDRIAGYGIIPGVIAAALQERNTTLPAGTLNTGGRSVELQQTNEFRTLADINYTAIGQAGNGTLLYLRDLGIARRGYQHPARFLSFYTRQDAGLWRRGRAVTVSVEMRKSDQIERFGASVGARIDEVRRALPADLVVGVTSDQRRQVREKIDLFNRSLFEAVALVIVVSLIGFWEWRSALLMAISIPVTLAMTFGFMQLLGLDIQQMSIASLIIALGLLVDDPVVAGDAIKRELAHGKSRLAAAWLGPTKLSKAILYATITNVAAYLPFLLLTGDVGRYIYSLPVTIACSLVASRLVSMTFIPLLAFYLLRAKAEPAAARLREKGFGRWYSRAAGFAIEHRRKVLATFSVLLVFGGYFGSALHHQFFPRENFYIAYVDIRLAEDAPLDATEQAVREAEAVVEEEAVKRDRGGEPLLASMTSFIGAGGPRFWFSVSPEAPSPNYAQLLLQFTHGEDTNALIEPLQEALSARVPGALIDVRTVETGPPTLIPISIRVLGEDAGVLRTQAEKLKAILKSSPLAINIRDDWGNDALRTHLDVNQDQASLAGLSSQDIAISSYSAMSGVPVGVMREGRKNIPIVQLMNYGQRDTATALNQLYVYSEHVPQNITLGQVAKLAYTPEPIEIHRVNQYRAITVSGLPKPGHVASEATDPLMPALQDFEAGLPDGYRMEIVGELKEQIKGQRQSLNVVVASVIAIYLALVFQFRNAIKPLVVFAGIPFGAVSALAGVWLMRMPLGFMVILGITSLIGVIVSHVIVLFDFIEERHEQGENLRDALIDAGILRIRPVLITVAATVLALFPLALHGGPLWEALCYAQIGGLSLATLVTLFIVPVIYSIFVLDLRVIKWGEAELALSDTVPPGDGHHVSA
jgi:multidrug efflux pump subunit AcrB